MKRCAWISVTCCLFLAAGCGSLTTQDVIGIVTDPNTVDMIGQGLSVTGTATGQPVLIGIGAIVAAVATWLKSKKKK